MSRMQLAEAQLKPRSSFPELEHLSTATRVPLAAPRTRVTDGSSQGKNRGL